MGEDEDSSVEELIQRSLDSSFEADDEPGNAQSWQCWEAICILMKKPGEQVFESATSLLRSCDPWRRARGADILGQFQQDAKTSERFDTLSAALEIEKDDRTLTSLICAISQLQDERILPKYLDHAAHPKPEVRLAVAMSINPNWGNAAVATLCALCSDESPRTRDWATFKFRTSNVDSPEIRECLKKRLLDGNDGVRAEAIYALARRHDLACLKQLVDDLGKLDLLEDDSCLVEAACELIGHSLDGERSTAELRDELLRKFAVS